MISFETHKVSFIYEWTIPNNKKNFHFCLLSAQDYEEKFFFILSVSILTHLFDKEVMFHRHIMTYQVLSDI